MIDRLTSLFAQFKSDRSTALAYSCAIRGVPARGDIVDFDATTSQPRSLLSIARLNMARSRTRPSIWRTYPILSRLKTSRARAHIFAPEESRSARDRRTRPLVCWAGAGHRVSDRSMSERYRDLVQRRVSRAWHAWPMTCGSRRGGSVTPDFAAHARRLLVALGSRTKSMIASPALCSRSRRPKTSCALTTAT
jgi:hypothetical protein